MTHQHKRCTHCAVTYAYQSSGGGCLDELNDPSYCPDCKKVIVSALSFVPTRRKHDWVVTSDHSVETLVKLEAERVARVRASGGLPITRSPMTLYNMKDPTNHHRAGVLSVDGRTYKYEYWTKDGMDKGQVTIEVERDTVTGEVLGPWSLTDHWHKNSSAPTLLLDVEVGVSPTDDPTIEAFIDPVPLTSLRMPITSMLDPQSLSKTHEINDEDFLAHMGTTREVKSTFRLDEDFEKMKLLEPLPDGALPFYDVPEDVVVSKDPTEPEKE